MLAARILGMGAEEEREEKNESAPRSFGPGKLGRSSAAPVHEESVAGEVVASAWSETKFDAVVDADCGPEIFATSAGISGLCELPTTWRMPGRAASSSGAR